ncbi:protein BANP [Halyomorpha halys]|uniref:protein BANP n=1 Tax=Halyomorpha halys TaxID=286706 RepID=UPI0006D50C78|nr:protein BANP-like [Halyomorpha halys]
MSDIGKRIRIETSNVHNYDTVNEKLETRLSAMEKKVDFLMTTCTTILSTCEKILAKEKTEHDCCATLLLPKILFIDDYLRNLHKADILTDPDGSNPVGFLQSDKVTNSDSVQILTLNTEEDLPEGSWLGDISNPKARVRVDIPPSLLMHINAHCLTPEKMALTLLDSLFPREVLAVSNLSGKGKHSKRQLDPLLIYAIRCHLAYKFKITDKDWHRIKQNIDSKCRAVWRKKARGLPLGGGTKSSMMLNDAHSEESSDGVINISSIKVLRNSGGNNNKLIHIQDKHTVKVFSDEEFKELLRSPVELFSVEDSECFNLGGHSSVIQDAADNSENSTDKTMDDSPIFQKKTVSLG